MKFHSDYAVIKFEKLLEQESEIKGVNGRRILLAAAERPELHVRNYGEVISVPDHLTKSLWGINRVGDPIYFNSSPNEVIWLDELPISVKPGDKAYVHHNSIMNTFKDHTWILKEEKRKDGGIDYYVKVLVSQIFCSVRNKDIYPNATWTLVEPDMETWDDILRPIPETINGAPIFENVSKMNENTGLMEHFQELKLKPKDQWLQIKVMPEAKLLQGYVRHVGPPLTGEPIDIHKDEKILYRNNADFEVIIENKKYFLIKQRDIEAIL